MRPMRMYSASCGTEMSEAVVAHVSAADTAAEKENCEGGSGGGVSVVGGIATAVSRSPAVAAVRPPPKFAFSFSEPEN